MQLKKTVSFLFASFIALNIFSSFANASQAGTDGWSVVRKGKGDNIAYFLKNQDHQIQIDEWNVIPKIKEVIKIAGTDVVIVVFHATTVGTSQVYDDYQGAIYNLTTKKYYGTYLYKSVLRSESLCTPEDGPDCDEEIQPVWKIGPQEISIRQTSDQMWPEVIKLQ